MAGATSIKIDTTEATKKIKELQVITDNLNLALGDMTKATTTARKAMVSFVEACGKIDPEKFKSEFSL